MKIVRHTYRTRCTTVRQPPGFGDYLRGSIGLAILAQEQGFSLKIDLSHHPVGAFVRDNHPPIAPPAEGVGEEAGEIAEFFNERADLLPTFLANMGEDESVSLTTNCVPDVDKVTDAVRELVRSQLTWESSIEAAAEDIRRQISEEAFAILHIRVADEHFQARSVGMGSLCGHIEKHVLPNWRGRLLVLSNNQAVKRTLSERYSLPVVPTGTVHLGECNGVESDVRDTLIDFAIMSRASTIFSHSAYSWNSGFSRWCACLYDVPFVAIRIPSNPLSQIGKMIYDGASRTMRAFSR
jgi:hypothetical protein